MKRTLVLILLFFVSVAYTQDLIYQDWKKGLSDITTNDSIINYSKSYINKVSNSQKVEIYKHIAKTFYTSSRDSSLFYYNKAIEIGESIKNKEILIAVYISQAGFYMDIEDIEKAEVSIEKAKFYYEKYNDSKYSVDYYGQLSRLKGLKGETEESYRFMNKSIDLAHKINDTITLPNLYHNLGIQYYNDSKFEKATSSFIKALELKERQGVLDVDVTYYMLGYIYSENNNKLLAKKYLKKSIESSKKSENQFILLFSHAMISKSYTKEKLYDKTIKHLDSAKRIAQNLKMSEREAQIDLEIGHFYLNQYKDYETAKNYYDGAYLIAKNSNIPHIKRNAARALFNLNLIKKKYKKAYKYLNVLEVVVNNEYAPTIDDKSEVFLAKGKYYKATEDYEQSLNNYLSYYALRDSISSVESNTKIAELEKKYDTQGKELKIIALDKERREQELLTQRAKSRQNMFLLLAGLLASGLVFGFWINSKLKKQKRELSNANNSLNKVNGIKNRLFSIIAHDLRGMLIPFQRAGKVLSHHVNKKNYDRVKVLSNELQNNSNNLSNMLDNLLNWSLVQMNGYVFKVEELSLKKEFENLISNFRQHSKDKETNLELIYTKDHSILFDKGAFHIIFRNLIGNALKYTENGTIKIEFEKEFNILKCSVSDTGVGMSENQQAQLFQFEGNNSAIGTQGEKGTGIGLNLVHRFVTMQKGKISVSSKLQIGTRFDLSFPILETSKDIVDSNSISA
ncbi:HAMP domain-containing sensor histidine kinase [uncultured Lacinutrix sp.]|uniref:ATP-binding protein n=1 Tax=uncultured Lacinutrix sp. TaxID=574032 RepID=UPI00260D595D|nr:HAMP domain-containing sensor histidine kinase [uncultured Lacinutrix sp.]